jgi:hypothetical protein
MSVERRYLDSTLIGTIRHHLPDNEGNCYQARSIFNRHKEFFYNSNAIDWLENHSHKSTDESS